jgi:uncharacterized membrane protein
MLLYIIGLYIHIKNLIYMSIGEMIVTPWLLWVNSSMLIYNITLLTGLIYKKLWAYYVSLGAFALFAIVQLFSLLFIKSIDLKVFSIVIITVTLCIAAIMSLIKSKQVINYN